MNEDNFNMSVRKFLKKVGVTAQREIEAAVRQAMADGRLAGSETMKATVTLNLDKVDLNVTIDGDVNLE
jgi:ribosomal protein L1